MSAYRLAHAMQFFRMFLGMNRVTAKTVPELLNFNQKNQRLFVIFFFCQKQYRNHASATAFNGLGPLRLFSVLKTEKNP